MLRPSFPGGVPYPPRPGETAVRYVFPPGAAGAPPPGAPYSAAAIASANAAYARQQPQDVRSSSERAGSRMPLRNPAYPLYHGDPRDHIQVLSVGGRPEAGVHVVGGPPPPAPITSHHSGLEAGPSKRARMADLPPLRIETREAKPQEPGYHPQVEAISPTPDDRATERDDVRSTKEDLLQKISKVDREIAKAESQIAKLKKKQHELEDAANKPSTDSSSEENAPPQSLAQMVYSENRRKAEQSHASLNKLSSKNVLPLYNQPSDTEQYSNNKKSYTVFKKKLVEYFKKQQTERELNDKNMLITYCKLSTRWNKKIDRIENSRKRKEREAKCREMYEKMFPELRKQREDKERDARLGTRGVVKSDADFEDVIERLQEQENEDKKMHSYAVIPPLLLPEDLRKRKFTNTNGLIPDPLLIYNDRKYFNMWTEAEKETFREKFLQHPKNFGAIAQYLERKTVADCVQYYYLSKKTENYKTLLRKQKYKRQPRRNPPPQPQVQEIPNLPGNRVSTRRAVQEAEKVKEEVTTGRGSRSGTPNIVKNEENGDGEKDNGKKKPDRARDAKKVAADNQNDSSDDEDSNQAVKSGPHPCVICKQIVDQSRAVSKTQAAQLGLKEEDVGGEVRVCNKCWCATLKKKHICPIPTCTSSKGRNRAKLRHLPSKWSDLDTKSKETIMNEMQLPESSKKVCPTCFTRINRRIAQLDTDTADAGDNSVKKEKEETVQWSDAEIETAKTSLKNNGTNWPKMAEHIKTKTEKQCKEFFYAQRKRLQLDKLVTEYKKSRSDKPSLTSDEESGSTTSSCEDEPGNDNNTDTKHQTDIKPPPVAAEPVKTESSAADAVKKEDSDATISADETGDHAAAGGKMKPKQESGQPDYSVNNLLEQVIEKTLQTQAPTHPPNIATTSTSSLNINKLLDSAPSIPTTKKNNTGGQSSRAEPLVTSRPELEVRAVAGPAPGADVLDLTVPTPRPERSSPAVGLTSHTHIPSFSYRGLSKPRPEPEPDSRGKEPPPAHGGADVKAKTTHGHMLQEAAMPQMMRKENKSPFPLAPPVHLPGPVFRGDPRKEINKAPDRQRPAQPGHRDSAPAARPSAGSIVAGTPHPRPGQSQQGPPALAPAARPGAYDHKGSILSGLPISLSKPISPRGPAQPGRSSQPPPGLAASSLYPLNHHPVSRSEPSPSGTPSSSKRIIEGDFRTAQQLRTEPRRDDPRGYPGSSSSPAYNSPYGGRGGAARGDPRADMRPDPRADIRGDPRADIPSSRADPRDLIYRVEAKDPRTGAGLVDPRLYGHYDPRSGQQRVTSVPGPSPSGSRGSITQGVPKQQPREVEIYPSSMVSSRHHDVVITKQTQPPQSLAGARPEKGFSGLDVFADIVSQQNKLAAVSRPSDHAAVISSRSLLDARQYDARPKPESRAPPASSSAGLPVGLTREHEQLMSKISVLSDQEKMKLLGGHRDHATMNTSNLIDAIITHQINKNTSGSTPIPGSSRHSPGQGHHDGKESPSKIPSRSPSVKSGERDGQETAGVSGVRTSPATVGEHLENMINKEVTRSSPSTSVSYQPGASSSAGDPHEHWKRRGFPAPAGSISDERQILRVAGPGQERPDKPPSRSSVHEAISPPATSVYPGTDPNMVRYLADARRKQEAERAMQAAAAAAGSAKAPLGYGAQGINDDYLKHKITEMMKNDKLGAGPSSASGVSLAAMGPPHKRPLDLEARSSPSDPVNPESPRKKYKAEESVNTNDMPDSPESGNMVIDETARPDSAHSHKTSSPAPASADPHHSSFRAQPPPRSSPAPTPPGARPPPANPRYEPLSDDD